MDDRIRSLDAYLQMLAGPRPRNGWLELRHRASGPMRSEFFRADSQLTVLRERCLQLGPAGDVYVGCAVRSRPSGIKAAVRGSWVAWVDCDGPDAVALLERCSPGPTMVVASGTPGHVHAYWALGELAAVDAVEATNRRLAATVSGDRACCDAGRVLRPPGTHNHKRLAAILVEPVFRGSRLPVALDDLEAGLRPASKRSTEQSRPATRPRRASDLLVLSAMDYVPALTGLHPDREGKVCCPFHEDRTPSLHLYREPDRGWFCFGCRRGGSIFDFASALWDVDTKGRDFLELKARLAERLGFDQKSHGLDR